MTTATFPPYGRLVTKLTAIGPYLRQEQTSTELFFFDCLASCINANKDPEKREFWGWWMELTPTERGFSYRYFLAVMMLMVTGVKISYQQNTKMRLWKH